MPTYPITAPDGRVFPVTGDSPPSEEELEDIYANLPSATSAPADPKARLRPIQQTPLFKAVEAGFKPTPNQVKQAVAENLVAEERASGFRPGELITRNEAIQLAGDAGIPVGDIGFLSNTGRLSDTGAGNAVRNALALRELASGATVGLGGAVGRLVEDATLNEAQKSVLGSQALKERAPDTALGYGLLGGALPTGAIAAGTRGLAATVPLASRLLRGGAAGAATGALAGASGKVEEKGFEATPGEVVESAVLPAVGGAFIGTALTRVFTPQAIIAANKLAKVKDFATNTLSDVGGFTSRDAASQERLVSGAYTDVLPEIAPFIEKGTGAKGFFDASAKALKERGETFAPLIKNANPNNFNRESLLAQAKERLARDLPEPESRAAALAKVTHFIDTVTADNVLSYNGQLNDDLTRFYKSAVQDASADVAFAKKAVRDVFGEAIRKSLEDAGVDANVYSKYGLIHELTDIVGDNFRKQTVAHATLKGQGPVKRFVEGTNAPLGSKRGILTGVGNVVAPTLGGEPARINRQINRIFDRITPSKVTTPAERQLIIENAKANRANYEKIAEFSDSLAEARAESLALAATPEELQDQLNILARESRSIEEANPLRVSIPESLPAMLEQEAARSRALGEPATAAELPEVLAQLARESRSIAESGPVQRSIEESLPELLAQQEARSRALGEPATEKELSAVISELLGESEAIRRQGALRDLNQRESQAVRGNIEENLPEMLGEAEARSRALGEPATAEELPGVINELQNESAAIRREGEAQAVTLEEAKSMWDLLDKSSTQVKKDAVKAIRAQSTEGEKGLLSNYWHALNNSTDPNVITRMQAELERRLGYKKYSKNWPEIRDALGRPQPVSGSNLPTKRELGVSEAISESVKKASTKKRRQ